jgi:hypothetical protein
MKRILLLGIILAICILAMPQGVLAATASSGGSAVVSATIEDYINLVVTGPSVWTLSYTASACGDHCNVLSPGIKFDISSNDGWTLTASKNGPNDGYLKAGTYNLANRLFIGPNPYAAPENWISTDAAHKIETGLKGVTPQFSRDLQQTLSINDDANLGTYSITLAFDATTNT